MKIGLLTDLHLGGQGDRRWHNRLLYGRMEEVVRATVEALNRRAPDLVLALGDLTQHGAREELALAARLLDGLACPWYAVPGNHERAAVRDGVFDALLAGRALPPCLLFDSLAIAGLREDASGRHPRERFVLDEGWGKAALEAIVDVPPAMPLLVACHFPLLPEPEWATRHAGKDAGCLDGGAGWLALLRARRGGRPLLLCGHQHWHHLHDHPGAVQCTTAALAEYPMEARLLTMTPEALRVETLPAALPGIAAASLAEATFVAGRSADRSASLPHARVFDARVPAGR